MKLEIECEIEEYLPILARRMNISIPKAEGFLKDLDQDVEFLASINSNIMGVPEFSGKQFTRAREMRVYRVLLYLITRILKPSVFVETGVHNGMSSAFILLAMQHNGLGELISIDLPPVDQRILDQGTNALPKAKSPGWLIPEALRVRHDLRLGQAERILPQVLEQKGQIDVFLHDSDHSYSHIMFELAAAWPSVAPAGWLIVDNIEQNDAFSDFVAGVGAKSLTISTFDGEERVWRHGLLQKVGG